MAGIMNGIALHELNHMEEHLVFSDCADLLYDYQHYEYFSNLCYDS